MFEPLRNIIENKKADYIHKKRQVLLEIESNLEEREPLVKVFLKHEKLMEEEKFDWIHEAQIEKLNFNEIKSFLKDFLIFFNRDTDKQFKFSYFFKKIFPLKLIFLYFKNLNLSFGNKVYDESLRFKTQLLTCFREFYLKSDFIHNYIITFNYEFHFDGKTRNCLRKSNREEMMKTYETDDFSLKEFIYFLLDHYYPRVGWRWIGASHFVYYLTLEIIVILFEFGFWTVQDFDELLLKLYEISEVLVSLEKNSAKDSAKLAENFNKELIKGFSTAREYLTLIIIHSYQLLIDERVPPKKLENYKFYFNLIITRYIFNSTKIKKENLRNRNNLKQILFYLNSANFNFDPIDVKENIEISTDEDFEYINGILDKMYKTVLENDLSISNSTENKDNLEILEIKNNIFDDYLEIISVFFKKYNNNKVPLELFLQSKFLKRLVPIIDLLKNTYDDEVEILIDLTFCMINQLCMTYPKLSESDYFKTIVKEFFEIEPFKNLYTISKLVTENNLNLNKYFTQFLANIFIRDSPLMMKLFDNESIEINSSHEIFQGIIELFIKYFDHFNELDVNLSYMELKMSIGSSIKNNFLFKLDEIFKNSELVSFESKITIMSYEQIMKVTDPDLRILYVRTKEAYLLLKLYNSCMKNTFKTGVIEIKEIKSLLENNLCTPISNEIIKLYTQEFLLSANNVIINRLEINKSKNFILMENSFPIYDKDVQFIFKCYHNFFNIENFVDKTKEELKSYLYEVIMPFLYKFLVAFVYLNDSNKVFDLEEEIYKIIDSLLKILAKQGSIKEDGIESLKEKILYGEMGDEKDIFNILKETETSYTNYTKIKKICYNLSFFIKSLYDDTNIKHINCYVRDYFKQKPLKTNFNENLEDIMSKIVYISSIDSKESMKNMLLYCIEEFRRSTIKVKFNKFNNSNNFIFLKEEYFDVLCMLKICFEKNLNFKKTFIDLIQEESVEDKEKFFSKFWEFYRASLFFSAYNFFHNKLWLHISHIFSHLSEFMLQLTADDMEKQNKILKYFFDFKLVTSFNNNHVIYFQIYVILECLGNYNKLLYLKDIVRIEQKETIFFVIQKLFRVLSNILKHPEAQMKIYVYRIDIWMNLMIININDLDSPFYDLKDCLTDYFLSIAGGEKPQIVKFYGANVNPEILKNSINKLFELLLKKKNILHLISKDCNEINKILQGNKIYRILNKMFLFYNMLIRHDVQTNYLHSFLERKISNLPLKIEEDYLIKKNLLFFYYADKIYSKINFQNGNETSNVFQILKEKNKVEIYPLFVNLLNNGEVKLKDLLNHLISPNDNGVKKLNKKLSIILQLMKKNRKDLTLHETNLLKKIQENDFVWIKNNILNN